jgi:SAM-dependent methyltransferase
LIRTRAALPPEDVQLLITPYSGDEALQLGYETFKLIRWKARQHGRPLRECDSVLDFGCGWGRVIRYFDVKNLWGIDVSERAIEACEQTIPFARFRTVEPLGPTDFEDGTFDLIYAYSVFTHLSEEAHLQWLREFRRILRPGGLLVLTTLGRTFLEQSVAKFGGDDSEQFKRNAAQAFSQDSLAAYDRGEYIFSPTSGDHFGTTCIPEAYIRARWPFDVVDYFFGVGQMFVACRHS